MKSTPPKLPLRFLRWFCHPDLLPSIEGDLMELFDENVKDKGPNRAKWCILLDVVKLFRPSIIRPLDGATRMNTYGVLSHNLKMTSRVLRKEKIYAILNTLGLTVGMATFLIISAFVLHHKSFDNFHENSDNIFRVTSSHKMPGDSHKDLATTPPRLARHIANSIPDINRIVRVHAYNSAGNGDFTYYGKMFRDP